MSTLGEQFPDSALDSIGKVLILAKGHGLKVAELKRLLRAEKVKKAKFGEELNVDLLLGNVIGNALSHMSSEHRYDHNIYFVSGASVVSTMLYMRTDKFVSAIELNAKKIKKLHNACLTKRELEKSAHFFENAEEQHKKAVEILKKQKRKTALVKMNKKISSIVKDYAKLEIQHELETIEEIMKSSW